MHCPVCNNIDTKVNDSRLTSDNLGIRRRRECLKCGFRFSTIEEMEILDLTVTKRNGEKEAYSREKIERGLKKALEKRPVMAEDFKKLIHNIERDIQKKKKREITSKEIGEIIMKKLKNFDEVAYIRFASVYRSFEDVETFQRELNNLLRPSSRSAAVKKKNLWRKKSKK
ncbi:MAG: transcriptional regulator NrdR [Patescibacteria group bacterium]|nr:transcriptional regulator NrdR [Patescibacteria group bacterium]MDD5490250.1 transcriptional regulator NrdR [Patescibacteria group bacterium]